VSKAPICGMPIASMHGMQQAMSAGPMCVFSRLANPCSCACIGMCAPVATTGWNASGSANDLVGFEGQLGRQEPEAILGRDGL
jgi:hypothetical protein